MGGIGLEVEWVGGGVGRVGWEGRVGWSGWEE